MGGAGRSVRLFACDEHHLGSKSVAVIQSREVAANQGFLKVTRIPATVRPRTGISHSE